MMQKKIEKLPGLSNVTGRYTKKSPYDTYSSTQNVSNRIPISASSNSVKKSAVRSTSEEVVPSLFNSTYNKRKSCLSGSEKPNRLVSSTSLSPSRYESNPSNIIGKSSLKKHPKNISSPSWSSSLSNASNNNPSISPYSTSPSIHYLSNSTSAAAKDCYTDDEIESFEKKKSIVQIRPAGIIRPQVVESKNNYIWDSYLPLSKSQSFSEKEPNFPGILQTQRILTKYIPDLLLDKNNSFHHLSEDGEKYNFDQEKSLSSQLRCLENRIQSILTFQKNTFDSQDQELSDDATPKPRSKKYSMIKEDEVLNQFTKPELEHLLGAVRVLLTYEHTKREPGVAMDSTNKSTSSEGKMTNQKAPEKTKCSNPEYEDEANVPGSETMLKKLPIGFQNFTRYLDNKFGSDLSTSNSEKNYRNDTPLVSRHRINQKYRPNQETFNDWRLNKEALEKMTLNQPSRDTISNNLRRTQSEPEHGDILFTNQKLNEISKKTILHHNQPFQNLQPEMIKQTGPGHLYHAHTTTGYQSLPEDAYYSKFPYMGQQSTFERDYYGQYHQAPFSDEVYDPNMSMQVTFRDQYGRLQQQCIGPHLLQPNLGYMNQNRVINTPASLFQPIMCNYTSYGRPLTRSGSSITPGSIKTFHRHGRNLFPPMNRTNYNPNLSPFYPQNQSERIMFLDRDNRHYLEHNRSDQDATPICMISNSLSATDLAALHSSGNPVNSSSTDNLTNLQTRRALTPSLELRDDSYFYHNNHFENPILPSTMNNTSFIPSNSNNPINDNCIGDMFSQGGYIINNIAPQEPLLTIPNQNGLYNRIQNFLEKEMTTNFPLIKGWSQARTNTGRMFYAYSGEEVRFKNLIETTTWDHPLLSNQIPFCWERVDTVREGVYYRNILIPHCQRHHPNLWIPTEVKNQNIEKSQWFAELCDLQNSLKYRVMNGLVPIVESYKFNKEEKDEVNYLYHFKCMEYHDLLQVLHHLDRLFYQELKDMVIKFEKQRYLIAERMFFLKTPKEIFNYDLPSKRNE